MGKAIGNYEKIHESGEEANPGITEMEDARRRLGRLKSR